MTTWTDEHIAILEEGYTKGVDTREIGAMVNRSLWAVQQKAGRLGFKHRYIWKDEEVNILEKGYTKGTSLQEIGAIIGRSPLAAQLKARSLGLKHPSYTQNGNYEYGTIQSTLMHRLQDEPHCIRCGIKEFLTINHINYESPLRKPKNTKDYQYWLSRPIEETREILNVMCMRCNKIDYYNHRGSNLSSERKQALKRIAAAHRREIKCFKCDYNEDIRVVEIDHIIEDNYSSFKLYRRILNMPLDEVKRCYQLLCSNHNLWKRGYRGT